ncbi:MAG: long-chain fatty acid--CoA ligase, partial [Mycobacterium sp.]|nr:long-chain fatty acid--CoA ligase [Mycobacterium sp.]
MSDGAPFSATLATSLAGYGNAPCIEFEGRWLTGAEITGYVDAIDAALHSAGVPDGAPVGVVARNRPPHAAAVV